MKLREEEKKRKMPGLKPTVLKVMKQSTKNRTRRHFALVLAGIVVFTTTYSLILPALTLENNTASKMPGLKTGTVQAELLDCHVDVHQHTDQCYKVIDGKKTLICGQADYVLHTHDENCYDKDGNLVCTLPEITSYGPSEDATDPEKADGETADTSGTAIDAEKSDGQAKQDFEAHTHTMDCFEKGPKGESPEDMGWVTVNEDGSITGDPEHLICGRLEVKEHQHTADCFKEETAADGQSDQKAANTAAIDEKTTNEDKKADSDAVQDSGSDADVKADSSKGKAGATDADGKDQKNSADQNSSDAAVDGESAGEDGASAEKKDTNASVKNPESAKASETDAAGNEEQTGSTPDQKPDNASAADETQQQSAAEQYAPIDLTYEGSDYQIHVSGGEEAGIPADAELQVKEIGRNNLDYYAYTALTQKKLDADKVGAVSNRFFDISFISSGKEIEPSAAVNVEISFDQAQKVRSSQVPQIVHFKESQTELLKIDPIINEEGIEKISFDTESFSVFGVVYTVDFHYEINGKVYDFSIPGGGFVSLAHVVEVLGIASVDENTENGADNPENGTENGDEFVGEEPGVDEDGENDTAYEEAIELNEVEVSEATKKFVADVENVDFSSPELVDVSKAENEITVGQVKENHKLECQYSTDLTEDQIAEINAQTVKAGDWALISVQPFTSEEELVVTMKDRKVFTIRVTDYQISTNVLTADGQTYKITVTYDDDAQIPLGTKLVANEIEPGTDEYIQHLGQAWEEVNKEYFKVEEMRENYDESMGELPDVPYTNINTARFFDISLINNNEEIEPKAPVQVEISYVQGLEAWEGTTPGVVHYMSETKVEIIEDVETTIQDNEVTSFRYEQERFSTIGTYVGQEIQDSYVEPKLAAAPDPNGSATVKSANLTDEVLNKVVRSSLKSSDLLRAGETEQSDENDHTGLNKPEAHKTLTPNKDDAGVEDGTYTLTLSVKGHSSVTTETQQKKANVLVVMDRSSSMITNTVNDDETFWYYGTANTAVFRQDIGDPNNNKGKNYHFYGIVNGEYVELNANFTNWSTVNFTYWDGTYDYGWQQHYVPYPADAPLYVRSKKTRMTAEQEALSALFSELMEMNDAAGANRDMVEISVISFADKRYDNKSWANETEVDWKSGRNTDALMNAVLSNRFTSGTNWEEALQYAYEKISAKKTADGNEEEYYVVFLTDGEPTNSVNHSLENKAYAENDTQREECYDAAKDEAKNIATDFNFYNIFTYRTTEDEKYSIYLTNYAYGHGNENDDKELAIANNYSDAQTVEGLRDAFNNIFFTIEDSIGHGNVSITDTLTTDAMTTTVVHGKTNGYVYEVRDGSGTLLYTVTATGDLSDPTVVFNVPASSTKDYTATASTVGGRTVYSVTTAEGKVYKMALADVNDTTGQLVWDLSPVGLLLDGCTYSVSFIVWPDQDAYDYVAALNNSLDGYTWNTSAATYEDLRSTKGYEKGGVERYPSIVKKSDGTFAVLTNTDQQLHYSVIETTTTNGTTSTEITGPFYHDLELPDPMPLIASDSQIEKVWNISRDPDILAQLLYGDPENHYSIGFDILQDDNTTKYTSVGLGWDKDANNGEGAYIWKSEDEDIIYVKWDDDQNKYVRCSQGDEGALEIGTHWTGDFSIATGLMLSETRMNALGLDKSAYTWTEYPAGGTKYYLLEEGHDYTISEPNVGYEFDFDAPVYHPMLVDGVLTNVELKNVVKDSNGNITSYNITGMTSLNVEADGTSALTVVNTLRGYLNVEKRVMDNNGNENPSDDTEFEFTITVSNDDGLFEGDHIPWFAVNDCFYHTVDGEGKWHYYQVDKVSVSDGVTTWRVITEKGSSGPAYTFTSNTFNPDIPDKQMITCTNVNDANDTIVLELYGNPTTPEPIDSNKKVKLTRSIRQDQKLTIGNVPAGSEYTVEESGKYGYELKTTSGNTSGTIAPNSDTNVIFTNKKISTDVDIQKKKETGEGLSGAIFQLRAMSNGAEVLAPVEIGGIDNITKEINGEQQEFKSAFETTDEIHSLTNLPDGTYRLYEVYVPAGYINTLSCIEFAVSNGTVTCSMAEDEEKVDFNDTGTISLITITNTTGAALPNTGGPGTRLFSILGSILILGAGVLLWRRRRMI